MATRILAYILAIVLLLGGGVYAGYHYTSKYDAGVYSAKIDKINKDADNKVTLANTAKAAAELTQKNAADAAKRTYDETIATLSSTVAKLRAAHVVFHDPGRQSGHSTGSDLVGGSSIGVVNFSGGTAISPGATDFLLSFAQRADTVRASLLECQADDTSIRAAVSEYNASLKKIGAQTEKESQQAVDKTK